MGVTLMERNYSGIEVALVYHGADTLTLEVLDPLGHTSAPVHPAEALVAFNHPYLYLDAERGDPFSPRLRAEDDADILSADASDAPLGTIDPRD